MASLRHVGSQSKIDSLWKQVLNTFKWTQVGVINHDEENFANMKRQIDAITAEDISLEVSLSEMRQHPGFQEAVGNIHLSGTDVATMQVFVLPKNQRMPIHDHPHMIGILKVIKGCVQVNSYTFKEYECQEPGRTVLRTKKHTQEVCAHDVACILTPSERNFHSITALNGEAAFLDVLSPPYYTKMVGRDLNVCNYYEEGSEVNGPNGEKLVRLEEIPPPEDYWTVKGDYKGPPIQHVSASHPH